MNRYRLRAATPADADRVAEYHTACFFQTFAKQWEAGEVVAPDRDLDEQRFREWFSAASRFPTRIAVCLDAADDEPVGHVTTHGAGLVHLFVRPDHQGVGLGRHLLATGEAAISAAGHRGAELHTRVGNDRAVGFYRAAGWTLTDQIITTVDDAVSYREHVMVKAFR